MAYGITARTVLDPSLYKAMEDFAASNGYSKSSLLRHILKQFLENKDNSALGHRMASK